MGSQNAQSDNLVKGQKAVLELDRLRAGQPSTDLMLATSSNAQSANDFVAEKIQAGSPIVRTIIGEMGSGKTTLLRTLARTCEVNKAPYSIFIPSKSFQSPNAAIADFLMGNSGMIARALVWIARNNSNEKLIENLGFFKNVHSDCIATRGICGLVQFALETGRLVGADSNAATAEDVWAEDSLVEKRILKKAQVYKESLGKWLSSDMKMDFKNLINELNCGPKIVGLGPVKDSYYTSLIKAHLDLYRVTGTYPVFFIDEFESYSTIRGPMADKFLGLIRDTVDLFSDFNEDISDHAGGALFIFSTPDGERFISGYPALADRLSGSEYFSLASPSWYTDHLQRWDPEQVAQYFYSRFSEAATIDATLSGETVRQWDIWSENEDFKANMEFLITGTDYPPRVRIKNVICNYLDLFPAGTTVFTENHNAICFARRSSGNNHAESQEFVDAVEKRFASIEQEQAPDHNYEAPFDNSAGDFKEEFSNFDGGFEDIIDSEDPFLRSITSGATETTYGASETPTATLTDALEWYQSIPVLRPHFSGEKKNLVIDITKTRDPAVLAGRLARSRDHDPFVETIECQARSSLYFDFLESECQWVIDILNELSKGAFIGDSAPSVNLFRAPISDKWPHKLGDGLSQSEIQCYFFRLIVHIFGSPDTRSEQLLPDITGTYSDFEGESITDIASEFFLFLNDDFNYQEIQNMYGVADLKPDVLTVYHWYYTPATIRHWAYYQCACAGVIPKSEIIDSWVVSFINKNFEQKPKSSRSGIFMFTGSPINKLLGSRKISRIENQVR